MPKWAKFIIAMLLLPACFGAAKALWLALGGIEHADTTWVPLLAGAACWVVVYLLLPRPMLIYVFGHELTHAVWTWAFGGRVKKFKASAKGGHVIITKENFVITLAPYFFPIYAVLVTVGFALLHVVWGADPLRPWFLLSLGAAYAFHVTLTLHILKGHQTDISSQGYLFSGVVILLGNLAVLLVAIPLLTRHVGLLTVMRWWFNATFDVFERIRNLF